MARHPHRLVDTHYRGLYAHFLTANTYGRRPAFAEASLSVVAAEQLLRSAATRGFAVVAYCLMPDHVHVLVKAERRDADFVKWVNLWRQLSGYFERRRTRQYLWQEGCWDHTLRDDESMPAAGPHTVAELAAVQPCPPRCHERLFSDG